MLKSLKKEFNKIFNTPNGDKEATMKKDNPQPANAAPEMAAELASALALVASQTEALKDTAEKLAEMSALYVDVKTALDAVEAAKATLVAEAKATRLQARTEAVVAAIGTEKAPSLLAATEALDDVAFQAIVGAMATSFVKEAASPLFKEIGVSASADTSKVVEAEETAEAKMLKAKYQTK